MTAHQLAKYLLERVPDLPVLINGWGSSEGSGEEVTGAFLGDDNEVLLGHGDTYKDGTVTDWAMRGERL